MEVYLTSVLLINYLSIASDRRIKVLVFNQVFIYPSLLSRFIWISASEHNDWLFFLTNYSQFHATEVSLKQLRIDHLGRDLFQSRRSH